MFSRRDTRFFTRCRVDLVGLPETILQRCMTEGRRAIVRALLAREILPVAAAAASASTAAFAACASFAWHARLIAFAGMLLRAVLLGLNRLARFFA